MRKILCALVLAAALFPCQAWAAKAVVGVYGDGETFIEVVALEPGLMRVYALENGEPEQDGYMLMENGRRWLVMQQGDMAEAVDFVLLGANAEKPDISAIKLYDTGRVKTLGGLKGVVYEFDDHGDKGELVLSNDARAAMLSPGLVYLFQDINTMLFGMITGPGPFLERINKGRAKPYGLLGFEGIELQKIVERDVPESFFKLPEGVEIIDLEELPEE